MERRPMVSSQTWRLRYKMNMPKVIGVRIRPSEKYLSNGFEWSLGQIGHVDADGPTWSLFRSGGWYSTRDIDRGIRLIHC